MKAIIKYLHSADADELDKYVPKEKDNFMLGIEMIISPTDGEGEEVFQFLLCTPKYLLKQLSIEKIIFGRHYVIVDEYNYIALEKRLNDYVNTIDEVDWNLITEKISRIAQSEFEDYRSE